MKIVINQAYGGFKLSKEAIKHICDNNPLIGCFEKERKVYFDNIHHNRDDSFLVDAVESLGALASPGGSLVVKNIPDDMDYAIDYNDGYESIELIPAKGVTQRQIKYLLDKIEELERKIENHNHTIS